MTLAVARGQKALDTLAGGEPRVILIRGDAVRPEPIRWLWPGWLARGKLHLLAGRPGTGKTTLALALAAIVTTGGRWPDGSTAESGAVAVWSGEDGIEDTLVPRFLAAGGNPLHVHFVGGIEDEVSRRPFDPAADIDYLAERLAEQEAVRLIVVDPLVSAVSGDSHKNAETRRGLQPLVDLAARLDCAVLGITHLSKGTSGRDPLERVTGSLAFGAVARVVILASRRADSEDRVLARAKSNIGEDGGGFAYRLEADHVGDVSATRIAWGAPLSGAAVDLLNDAEADEAGAPRAEAEEFLADLLGLGPCPVQHIKDEARAAGHSWATVRRAKDALGVVARKVGTPGSAEQHWAWSLPEEADEGPVPEEIEVEI